MFFDFHVAKTVWGTVGKVMGAECIPTNLWQSLSWFYAFLPGGYKFYMIGIAAICWGIWTVRNKVTFDAHVVRSPVGSIFTICSFLMYWSGLLKGADKEIPNNGVQMLMKETSRLASLLVLAGDDGANT